MFLQSVWSRQLIEGHSLVGALSSKTPRCLPCTSTENLPLQTDCSNGSQQIFASKLSFLVGLFLSAWNAGMQRATLSILFHCYEITQLPFEQTCACAILSVPLVNRHDLPVCATGFSTYKSKTHMSYKSCVV